jgi:hypothetical protein
MVVEILAKIGAGTICGVVTAALGYAKSAGNAEAFDDKKFVQTAVVGAIVGGVGGEMGMTYTQAYEWASTVGLVTIIEYIKKALWRIFHRKS